MPMKKSTRKRTGPFVPASTITPAERRAAVMEEIRVVCSRSLSNAFDQSVAIVARKRFPKSMVGAVHVYLTTIRAELERLEQIAEARF